MKTLRKVLVYLLRLFGKGMSLLPVIKSMNIEAYHEQLSRRAYSKYAHFRIIMRNWFQTQLATIQDVSSFARVQITSRENEQNKIDHTKS